MLLDHWNAMGKGLIEETEGTRHMNVLLSDRPA